MGSVDWSGSAWYIEVYACPRPRPRAHTYVLSGKPHAGFPSFTRKFPVIGPVWFEAVVVFGAAGVAVVVVVGSRKGGL